MWELDHKEGWVLKNWCFEIVVLEKTLETSLDSKEIKPVIPKGNQPWILIGGTDAEAEAPILWPPDVKKWLTGKDPDARKDWRWEEKGATEDETVGWHHWLNGANSGSWWWTGKPGMLQSMGLQRVRHNWVTEQQQNVYTVYKLLIFLKKIQPAVVAILTPLQAWSYLILTTNLGGQSCCYSSFLDEALEGQLKRFASDACGARMH